MLPSCNQLLCLVVLVHVVTATISLDPQPKSNDKSEIQANAQPSTPSRRLTAYEQLNGFPYTVGFTNRSVTINGTTVLLQSGAIHYPRSTPALWPRLMNVTRDAGLNMVQTYVFWNLHETHYRDYDFETDNKNLNEFLQAAQDAGLFVFLRIGPFVCAEWTYGGLPTWLRQENMVFRTNDTAWEFEMATFTKKVIDLVEPYLARNGGPIILAQIENEYDNMEGKDAGNKEYVKWCGELVTDLDLNILWNMCSSQDAPKPLLNSCNGFYCHDWIAGHVKAHPNEPHLWTEHWSGWFQHWGEAKPARPAEDDAYAVARWFASGGGHHNYYMWQGGTTMGRWTGGPFITTSYDYNAPVDEYGYPHEPKYTHLSILHNILSEYDEGSLGMYGYGLLTGQPIPPSNQIGKYVFEQTYGLASQWCLAFLTNPSDTVDETVQYYHKSFTVPAWSVSIIDCTENQFLYNTATLPDVPEPTPKQAVKAYAEIPYQWAPEVYGLWTSVGVLTSTTPLEQINITGLDTDYLWYVSEVTVTGAEIKAGSVSLSVSNANDVLFTFFNGVPYQFSQKNGFDGLIDVSSLSPGTYSLQLCVQTVGFQNCCGGLEKYTRGLQGKVLWNGVDITSGMWSQLAGLYGEANKFYNPKAKVNWQPAPLTYTPFTWYLLTIQTPTPQMSEYATWQLDLGSMGKGFAWVNGNGIGRYWNKTASGTPAKCDYRGTYSSDKCRYDFGKPSQQYYAVPADWLLPVGQFNFIVLFEEWGGDPTTISLIQRN